MAGIPDITGSDAWRQFFSEQGFHDDAGEPGKDVRFGIGKPLIENILKWLKTPNWLVWLMVLFCFTGEAIAQETKKSSIENASVDVVVKRIESITYNDTPLATRESVVSETQRPVVVVRTEAPNPLVRGYDSSKPFPPQNLKKVGDGVYLLEGKPGSSWTIEILSSGDNGWWTEYLNAKIGDGTNPNPPNDPVDPDPDDPTWLEELTKIYVESEIPDKEPEIANAFADAYLQLAGNPPDDLNAMQRKVGQIRENIFLTGEFTQNWNSLFLKGDALIQNNIPQNTAEYAAILRAIAKGMRR